VSRALGRSARRPARRPGRRARSTRPEAGPALYSAGLLQAFAGGAPAGAGPGPAPLRPRLARALALADLRPGLAVVDVGAGRGEAAERAARRGARVTALDFSPGSLALTRSRQPGGGLRPAPALLAADATALPLASGSADRVLFLDVLEHLAPGRAALALAEIRRILRPGGYVVVHTLPNRWALAAAYPVLRLAVRALPAEPRSAYEQVVHVNEQDPRSLAAALSAAGLCNRVWVEEWTTRQAAWGRGWRYPDATRRVGYPALATPRARRWARWLMATPARWLLANDLFALAWRPEGPPPPAAGRFAPVC
jgi:ubiquinone/menaquinone biosynthesis C-methylase UbiE